jgi:hypothetical protein
MYIKVIFTSGCSWKLRCQECMYFVRQILEEIEKVSAEWTMTHAEVEGCGRLRISGHGEYGSKGWW